MGCHESPTQRRRKGLQGGHAWILSEHPGVWNGSSENWRTNQSGCQRFGWWMNWEEKESPGGKRHSKRIIDFQSWKGLQSSKGWGNWENPKKLKHLAQRNPTREDSVLASVPGEQRLGCRPSVLEESKETRSAWRLRQGRMKVKQRRHCQGHCYGQREFLIQKDPQQYIQCRSGLSARKMVSQEPWSSHVLFWVVKDCPWKF